MNIRRTIGIIVCFGPAVLVLASLVYGIIRPSPGLSGLTLAIAGLICGLLNAYLSFIHPLLKHEGDRHTSGIPIFGSVLTLMSQVFGFGVLPTAIVAFLSLFLDTGGLPWFLLATWKDKSFWDETEKPDDSPRGST